MVAIFDNFRQNTRNGLDTCTVYSVKFLEFFCQIKFILLLQAPMSKSISSSQIGIQSFNEPSFTVVNEYDPLWPNDYQKVIQGMCIYITQCGNIKNLLLIT